MRRLANILCLAELVLLVLVPIVAWLTSVLNYDVVNLLSSEGIRWLFNHGGRALASLQLTLLILLLSAIGCVEQSGILNNFHIGRFKEKAFLVAIIFQCVVLGALFFPFLMYHNPLLGITGSLFPSPWLMGFPFALVLTVIASSLLYAVLTGRINGVLDVPHMLSHGISKYGIWIVVAMMGSLLYRIVNYSFGI